MPEFCLVLRALSSVTYLRQSVDPHRHFDALEGNKGRVRWAMEWAMILDRLNHRFRSRAVSQGLLEWSARRSGRLATADAADVQVRADAQGQVHVAMPGQFLRLLKRDAGPP